MSLIEMFSTRIKAGICTGLAAMMLASGCATNRQSKVISTTTSNTRITFPQQNLNSLDDLVKASNDATDVIKYSRRLDGIKARIREDSNYDPKGDIQRLYSDIQNSRVSYRSEISRSVRDFTYYKDETVTEKVELSNDFKQGAETVLTLGAVGYIIYASAEAVKEDEENSETSGDDSVDITKVMGAAVVLGIGLGLINLFMDDVKSEERTYNRRLQINPFDGTIKYVF